MIARSLNTPILASGSIGSPGVAKAKRFFGVLGDGQGKAVQLPNQVGSIKDRTRFSAYCEILAKKWWLRQDSNL